MPNYPMRQPEPVRSPDLDALARIAQLLTSLRTEIADFARARETQCASSAEAESVDSAAGVIRAEADDWAEIVDIISAPLPPPK